MKSPYGFWPGPKRIALAASRVVRTFTWIFLMHTPELCRLAPVEGTYAGILELAGLQIKVVCGVGV